MQPKTWDEVAEFAVKIKKATGKAGCARQWRIMGAGCLHLLRGAMALSL